MKLFIHALVYKVLFINFLSANNGLEHLCSQPDRFRSYEPRSPPPGLELLGGAALSVWMHFNIQKLQGSWAGAPLWPEGWHPGKLGERERKTEPLEVSGICALNVKVRMNRKEEEGSQGMEQIALPTEHQWPLVRDKMGSSRSGLPFVDVKRKCEKSILV